MAEAKTQAPEQGNGAGDTPAPKPVQAPKKKPTKSTKKEDPRGELQDFGGIKFYVKG